MVTSDSKARTAIRRQIQNLNWQRAPIFFFLMLVLEPLAIVAGDLPSLGATANRWTAVAYLVLHSALFLYAAASLAYGFLVVRPGRWKDPGPVEAGTALIGMTGLVLIALVTAVDQVAAGQITPFLANLLVLAALALIPYPWNIPVYGVPFAIFILGLFLFQKDPALLITNLANSGTFFLAALFISRFIYQTQYGLLEKNAQLDDLALHDSLTGLANRRLFLTRLEWERARAARSGTPLALVVADLDHFKALNDDHGHHAGDEVLKEVARILKDTLREADLVARWGGEEFLVLLPRAQEEEVRDVAERLRAAVESLPIWLSDRCLEVTASFGATTFDPQPESAFQEAFSRADAALYRAKSAGRNRVVFAAVPRPVPAP